VSRKNLTGSVTAACRGWVTIGSPTPAMAAISDAQPAVQFTTTGAAMGPRDVCTPCTRPPATSMPVTSVSWWMCTPRASAARA